MSREAVETYWKAAEARDWERFASTLAPDVVYRLPQTREVVRGRDAYVRFNAEYPGEWHLTVERLVADARQAVSWVRFLVAREELTGLTFFRFQDAGAIVEVTDFWPEAYDPPAGRDHLVARY